MNPRPLIFSTGYFGDHASSGMGKWDAFTHLIEELRLIVVDIRFAPWSQAPIWRKHHLQEQLGYRYQHVPELGNRNYKNGGPIEIVNIDLGLKRLLSIVDDEDMLIREEYRCPLILCACTEYERCHRQPIVEAAMATGRFAAHTDLCCWDKTQIATIAALEERIFGKEHTHSGEARGMRLGN